MPFRQPQAAPPPHEAAPRQGGGLYDWIRGIPVSRRILATTGLFLLTGLVLGLTAWRSLDILSEHRAAMASAGEQTLHRASLDSTTHRLQALVRQYLLAPNDDILAQMQARSETLFATIAETTGDAAIEQELGRLEQEAKRFVTGFERLKDLNAEVAALYQQEILTVSDEISGLFSILNHDQTKGNLNPVLGASLLKAGEAFVSVLVNLNGYYINGAPAMALKARSNLLQLSATAPVMRGLAEKTMHRRALAAIEERTSRMIEGLTRLEALFSQRERLIEKELDSAQAAMAEAAQTLVRRGVAHEAALQAQLEQRTRQVMLTAAVIAAVVLLVALALNSLIVASIRRPASRLSAAMKALAAGSQDVVIDGKGYHDEFGAMARTLEAFREANEARHQIEQEKHEALARKQAETESALSRLDTTHRELDKANRLLVESLRYARRIQTALLPDKDALRDSVAEIHVCWEPLDVVGGDYFWLERLEDDLCLVMIIDCTGHGVPGALMTMIVASALDRILHERNLRQPAEILVGLDEMVRAQLRQDQPGSDDLSLESDDGLDAGLCLYDRRAGSVTFAGAGVPLYYSQGGAIQYIKGNRWSLGYRSCPPSGSFDAHRIQVEPGMSFYLLTDGIPDHMGGRPKRLLGRRRLMNIIHSGQGQPMAEQLSHIQTALEEYRGPEPRRDDMTLIGFTPIAP